MSGFTLAFGSMFSKTYRVHAIFTNIKLNKKIIKDYKLFLVVAVLVCIDVATLTTWQIVDPFYRETSLGVALPSAQNEDILVVPEMEFCQSKRMTIFLGCIYVYKGLLMVIYSVVVCFPSSSIFSVVILTIDKYDIQTFLSYSCYLSEATLCFISLFSDLLAFSCKRRMHDLRDKFCLC